ncbi:ATP-binding protein [Mycolicibacterium gadium]|uniref:ATP-binding protein n=1 Tax=Mycolicibacterium gadium TaxID=1794 RepID=A0ABT6GPY0_MYCGU|nr:ATP-binding protein [Mycolicibacterium gadium]MDG5483344.1 ATP-binding protein [Mycolicibacterium gadium]
METKQVRAGRDTILANVDRTNPIDIIAELIWNALDAEAMNIETTVAIGEVGAPEEIVVRDDGNGIPADRAEEYFLTHGDSWKRAARFSPVVNRPLHGQLGRGRFLAYGIADRVAWRSVSSSEDGYTEIDIRGRRDAPHEYEFDGPWQVQGPPGTTVTMQLRQIPRVTAMLTDDFALQLTARLAASLLALPDISVIYRDAHLNPQDHILLDTDIPLAIDPTILRGKSAPTIRIVEWDADMKSKTMFLCDDRGGVVTDFKLIGLPPSPMHWTAYLLWEGFRDPDLMGQADLRAPDILHGELLAQAQAAITEYLLRRFEERKGNILAEWKAEGVYPYAGAPQSATEEIEREVFDIVAVVASPAIGRNVKQKRLSLRLLQQATRAEPSRTSKILSSVLDLTPDEQEVLVELLERTKLASIIRSAQTVADRADFNHGLRGLLYADETRTQFREVDQLHPMLVNEPWIFGDEWDLSLSEVGLTRLVRTLISAENKDAEFASSPVVLESGKKGRVDMVFSRHLPESERTRHLVVELKRPRRLTMVEFGQVNNYASAITGHPEVLDAPHFWDFWLVGTEIEESVRNLYSDPTVRPGLTTNNSRYRIWVMTWGQLLDQSERRIRAFQSALELVSTDQTSRDYLERVHAEFIPAMTPKPEANSG